MGKALIKGSLLGGIIFFIWIMISWMVLPWHCQFMKTFKNETAVANTLMENTENDGIYLLPNLCDKNVDLEERTQSMKKGPVIFASIQRYGSNIDSIAPYVTSLIIQFIGAFLIAYLLSLAKNLNYLCRVWFVTLIGLTIGVLGALPNWNWWGFSFDYVLIEILDYVIGWFLAGLVIAAFVKRVA